MIGEHNDGSTSHLVLTRSNRKLASGSFSQIESGDWAYELTNSFRSPSISEFWMIHGSPKSYQIKEVRNNSNAKTDTGEYSASWQGNHTTHSFSTRGDGAEPMHMYMAMEYHAWGNNDLGYRINFTQGNRSTAETSYPTSTKIIVVSSERTVGPHVSQIKVKDSQGVEHDYKNCYSVNYEIRLQQVEDRQLEVEGKINKKNVLKVIEKNRPQLLSCFKKARSSDPTLAGSVTINWDINDLGYATSVKAGGRSLTGNDDFNIRDEMVSCLIDAAGKWSFPPAAMGTIAHISFPFSL